MSARDAGPNVIAGTLVAFTFLSACSSWRTQPVTPRELIETQHPGAVRVERLDRSRIELRHPRLAPDSLVGEHRGQRSAVALADISRVAVRRGDGLKTGGLVLGIVATPFALIGIACALGADCNFGY